MEHSNEYKLRKAKERIGELKDFYGHALTYAIVISVLAFFNYRTTDFPWVLFPALGWGIGLFGHWAGTFGYRIVFGKNWEERKIKELMNSEEF